MRRAVLMLTHSAAFTLGVFAALATTCHGIPVHLG